MGSIAEEILRLQEAKLGIHNAIVSRGVEIPEGALLDSYPGYIDSIPSKGIYTYVAYASDDQGTDFSGRPVISSGGSTIPLPYRAEIQRNVEIEGEPTSYDFTSAIWMKYLGSDGVTPTITIGTVTTGEPGTSAMVTSSTGTSDAIALNFTIPRGSDGSGDQNVIEAITYSGSSATVTNRTAELSSIVPAVNNPTITIVQGTTPKGSFTLNQSSGTTITLDSGGTVNNGSLAIISSGATVTFTANQSGNTSVAIPSVGSGVLTISSGASVWTFNANQTSSTTINLGSGGAGSGYTVASASGFDGDYIDAGRTLNGVPVYTRGSSSLWLYRWYDAMGGGYEYDWVVASSSNEIEEGASDPVGADLGGYFGAVPTSAGTPLDVSQWYNGTTGQQAAVSVAAYPPTQTIGSGILTISSGGSTWSFNANQTSNTSINLGSGGGGGGAASSTIYSVPSSGGYIIFDYTNGDYQRISLNSNLTIASVTNIPVGCGMVLEVTPHSNAVTLGFDTLVSSGTTDYQLIGFFNISSSVGIRMFKNTARIIYPNFNPE